MTKPVSVFDQLDKGVSPTDPNAGAVQAEPVITPAPLAPAPVAAPAVQVARPNPIAVKPRASVGPQVEIPDASPAPAALAGVDTATLSSLVQLLMLREGREIKAMQEQEEREKVRRAQRDRNAKDQDTKLLLKQARCKHLKGGRGGPKTQNKDYALSHHRFVNFVQYIRCLICGMKWYPEDTAEYLTRKGKNGKVHQISNHTHIGWRDAINMMDASTNTVTTSESLPSAVPGATQSGFDAAGLPITPRIVDKDGVAVENIEM